MADKFFDVVYTETRIVVTRVEAESEEDAKEKVADGEGEIISNDPDDNQVWDYKSWTVEEVK